MTINEESRIEQAIDSALDQANKPTTVVGLLQNLFASGVEKRIPPKVKVVAEAPLTSDEAARVAEALEAEGFCWEIEGAKVNPMEVTDNVTRRSKSVPRIKRGA